LKFNRPFEKLAKPAGRKKAMRNTVPLLRRFFGKLVHDVLPAALASLIGGFLLSHYGLGRAPQTPVVAAVPASTGMMQLLDDEHALVADYLKAHLATEKRQLTGDGVAAKTAAEPQSAPVPPQPSTIAAVKAAPRSKSVVVGSSLPPLVIAQVPQPALPSAQALPAESAKLVAREDDSLLAKTIGIKDHVIAVTGRAVSAIGNIPAWFGTIGGRIGGEEIVPRPPADLVRAS
jgi:hypothetical protein